MAVSGPFGQGLNGGTGFFHRLKIILDMIKFEHTIFALPFALISMLLAARSQPHGLPSVRIVVWILAAMVGARSAAMAFNRLVDAHFDGANPRTAKRALPAGLLNAGQVTLFTIASVTLFLYASYALNPLCFALSPLALLAVLGYSYTKRFTSFCHLVLGFAIGIAPIGAWLAVTGRFAPVPLLLGAAVMLWIGGFDIIYALQDVAFDQSQRLHSLPQRLGKARALTLSRLMHLAMIGLLVTVGVIASLHAVYFLGIAVVAGLIAYEQSIVSPEDLSRVNVAFFTLNGWVSVSLFAFVVLDRLLH
jgi:4-hydroxybenzoate polyprenyltransferase